MQCGNYQYRSGSWFGIIGHRWYGQALNSPDNIGRSLYQIKLLGLAGTASCFTLFGYNTVSEEDIPIPDGTELPVKVKWTEVTVAVDESNNVADPPEIIGLVNRNVSSTLVFRTGEGWHLVPVDHAGGPPEEYGETSIGGPPLRGTFEVVASQALGWDSQLEGFYGYQGTGFFEHETASGSFAGCTELSLPPKTYSGTHGWNYVPGSYAGSTYTPGALVSAGALSADVDDWGNSIASRKSYFALGQRAGWVVTSNTVAKRESTISCEGMPVVDSLTLTLSNPVTIELVAERVEAEIANAEWGDLAVDGSSWHDGRLAFHCETDRYYGRQSLRYKLHFALPWVYGEDTTLVFRHKVIRINIITGAVSETTVEVSKLFPAGISGLDDEDWRVLDAAVNEIAFLSEFEGTDPIPESVMTNGPIIEFDLPSAPGAGIIKHTYANPNPRLPGDAVVEGDDSIDDQHPSEGTVFTKNLAKFINIRALPDELCFCQTTSADQYANGTSTGWLVGFAFEETGVHLIPTGEARGTIYLRETYTEEGEDPIVSNFATPEECCQRLCNPEDDPETLCGFFGGIDEPEYSYANEADNQGFADALYEGFSPEDAQQLGVEGTYQNVCGFLPEGFEEPPQSESDELEAPESLETPEEPADLESPQAPGELGGPFTEATREAQKLEMPRPASLPAAGDGKLNAAPFTPAATPAPGNPFKDFTTLRAGTLRVGTLQTSGSLKIGGLKVGSLKTSGSLKMGSLKIGKLQTSSLEPSGNLETSGPLKGAALQPKTSLKMGTLQTSGDLRMSELKDTSLQASKGLRAGSLQAGSLQPSIRR